MIHIFTWKKGFLFPIFHLLGRKKIDYLQGEVIEGERERKKGLIEHSNISFFISLHSRSRSMYIFLFLEQNKSKEDRGIRSQQCSYNDKNYSFLSLFTFREIAVCV